MGFRFTAFSEALAPPTLWSLGPIFVPYGVGDGLFLQHGSPLLEGILECRRIQAGARVGAVRLVQGEFGVE